MGWKPLAFASLLIVFILSVKGDPPADTFLNSLGRLAVIILVGSPLVSTTPLYSDLVMTANFFVLTGHKYSTYDRYSGYIVKVGDALNISCDKGYSRSANLFITNQVDSQQRLVSHEAGRVNLTQTDQLIVLAISNAQPKDSGRYFCNGDSKNLTVIAPDNPPRVLSHWCVSVAFNDITCTLLTNANYRDLVDWSVTFTTKLPRTCDSKACENVSCTEVKWLLPLPGDPGGRLRCTIRNWLFTDVTYKLTIIGSNPFVKFSSNVEMTLNYDIVQLPQFEIINHTNEAVQVELSKIEITRILELYDSPGPDEGSIADNGIRYRVTVNSESLSATEANWTVPRTYIFQDRSIDTWLQVPDLLPFTLYSIEVMSQICSTANKDVWSPPSITYIQTKEQQPEVAPKNSPYGFAITARSTRCHSERLATLYWKKVPEVPGKANGKIISYSIYNLRSLGLTSSQVLEQIRQPSYNQNVNKLAQVSVDGEKTFAEICVGSEYSELMLVPMNSVGFGQQSAKYYIPAKNEEVEFPACDISALYYETSDLLLVAWPNVPPKFNITVFWCEIDMDDNCLDQEIYWSNVGNETEIRFEGWKEQIDKKSQFKYGLSTSLDNQRSSGIIWASCINQIEKELLPATLTVNLQGLEAIITINQECYLESRMAEWYTVKSCRYDHLREDCVSDDDENAEIYQVKTDPCNLVVSIALKKNSALYAFWVISHAKDFTTASKVLIKSTDRKALTWEIALAVLLSLLMVVCITLSVVYCKRQRKKVQKLRHVQLVLPPKILIETDSSSTSGEEEAETNPFAYAQYAMPGRPLKPLVSCDESPETSCIEYKNHLLGMTSQPEDNDVTRDTSNILPSLGYQPLLSYKDIKMPYNNSSGSECCKLPDDYLHCTEAPLPYLDSGWSAADECSNTPIDINKYLHSGPQLSERYVPNCQHSCTSGESRDESLSEIDDESETSSPPNSSGPKEALTYNENEHPPEISSYCQITELALEPSNAPAENAESQTELSSGDSGYVGRHLQKALGLKKELSSS
ncbi:uncharacterized protein [Watersipora subatra]|uniref:uncharacterized protein isoform X2 n=1 Tax=Watersipora subatra TaxID=2589382 RepID=UPI00355AFE64